MHKSIYENKRLRLGAGIITAAMVSLALSAGLPVAKSRAAVVGYEKKMETDAEGFKISEGFQLVVSSVQASPSTAFQAKRAAISKFRSTVKKKANIPLRTKRKPIKNRSRGSRD